MKKTGNMDSPMLRKLKNQHPEKEYPANIGKKWSAQEEKTLLEELEQNIDVKTIAVTHNRTLGGINSRRREIAYRMYLKNMNIQEIMKRTKLDQESIQQIINKRQDIIPVKQDTYIESSSDDDDSVIIQDTEQINLEKVSLEIEITEMKKDIKEIKFQILNLVEMLKAVYEFEDV